MTSVGTTTERLAGVAVYNQVSAFASNDNRVEFQFTYTDPVTNRVRFHGTGKHRQADIKRVVLDLADIETLARLASVAADAITTSLGRERVRRSIAAELSE